MKKTDKTIYLLLLLLTCFAINSKAQLSGTYSINAAAPVSPANYTSFTSLANDLNILGVSGAVTVIVVPGSGPYVEQVTFAQPTGVSATNSVLIEGNGNTITFNASSSATPWTMLLNGADYMTVNNLTVVAQNSNQGFALKLANQSNYNRFNNCSFITPINVSSTLVMPVSSSATNNSYSSTGVGALNQYNRWTGCTMIGGYFGVCIYGSTSLPYTLGNDFVSCNVRDFYLYGIYHYYHYAFSNTANIIDRPNQTLLTTAYGIYLGGTTVPVGGSITINNNRIRDMYAANTAYVGTFYGIMTTFAGNSVTNKITVKNNIISDIKFNGSMYPLYCYGNFVDVVHNTISMDDVASSGTGVAYGVYYYGTGGVCKDNLITISRGGSGQKFGLYYASTMGTGTISSNGNHVYMAPIASNAFYGYHYSWGALQSYATWTTTTAMDFLGGNINPNFINPTNQNFMPTSYALNDRGEPVGVLDDVNGLVRSTTTPDPGAVEFLNTPCSGFPGNNSVVTPPFVQCPGVNLNLTFANSYTTNGLAFQWQSSTTSSVGPFTSIPNATNQSQPSGAVGQTTWFNAVVTCTNGNFATTAIASGVQIAGTTTNSVPYTENFDLIPVNNRLPNCSWASPSLGSTALTYTSAQANNRVARSGSGLGSFFYSPAGAKDFYTNGIQLVAGITYSASMWYITESFANWTNLSILVGTNQNSTGQTLVASTNGAAVSPVYTSLSNTFTVPNSGLYYFNIKATSNVGANGQYLSFDDFNVMIPCTPSVNAVPLTLTPAASTICSGQSVFATMSGANTYSWSTGVTTASMSNVPTGNAVIIGTGKSLLTGCTATIAHNVSFKQGPTISVLAFPNTVCSGKNVNIQAIGANSYNWSNSLNTAVINVAPNTSTGYTVIGTAANGCSGSGNIFITVLPNPNVQAFVSDPAVCIGETFTLSGIGAANYQWASNSLFVNTKDAVVLANLLTTTVYTLTGTDANGCSSSATVSLKVNACTNIKEESLVNKMMSVYPNPSSSEVNVTLVNLVDVNTIEILDVTGRLVSTTKAEELNTKVDVSELANGIYYIKVSNAKQSEVTKFVKQ